MPSRPAVPFVITAYTLSECCEDYRVISNAIGASDDDTKEPSHPSRATPLWEPEKNPFGSHIVRETKSSNDEYRENSAWQAWLLGDH